MRHHIEFSISIQMYNRKKYFQINKRFNHINEQTRDRWPSFLIVEGENNAWLS